MSFDVDEMMTWVARQAEFGARRPGSSGGQRSEAFLVDALRSFGIADVRLEPISVMDWQVDAVGLRLTEGAESVDIEAFAIPFAATTEAAGVRGRLHYVDRRELLLRHESLAGAIVVTDIGFPSLELGMLLRFGSGRYDPDNDLAEVRHPATWVRLGWHLYRRAARLGAAGFVGILRDQPGGSCQMFAPYGFKEKNILDKPLPGVWVSRDHGDRLRAAARGGEAIASLRLVAQRIPSLTHNIVAEIPGRSAETIVVSCHHDSPFASPVEDGSGVAVVLALAKFFAARRDLERRLVILLSAGHFYGSIGTRSFIAAHRRDTVANTVCEISIEHIAREAVENSEGRLVPSGKPEATGVFVPFNRAVTSLVIDSMRAHDVRRVLALPAEGPLGPYPPTDGGDWYEAGIPVINFISNPVYLLTNDDALSWVDIERLPRVAGAFADIILGLDRIPRPLIGAVDSRARLVLMKLLRWLAWAKTTMFGLRPVY